MAKGKKTKEAAVKAAEKEQEEDSDEMELSDEEEVKKPAKKSAETKKAESNDAASTDEDDSKEEEVGEENLAVKKKPGFALLMGESDDDSKSEEEEEKEERPLTKKVEEEKEPPAKKQGKKERKKKKQEEDDEDLDKMLAELELEYSGGKKAAAAPEEEEEEGSKKGKKKKKGKKDSAAADDAAGEEAKEEVEVVDGIEVGGTVKTAAQKKKEKKERQKKEKMMAAQKGEKRKEGEEEEEEKSRTIEEVKEAQESVEDAAREKVEEGEVEVEAEGGDKKKRKKKKGATEKEDDKKKGKKPAKGTLLAMQEALKKVQEEQERAKREEEERIRKEEEVAKALEEKKRVEAEKKALKKQREREKKEQLRKEGKLLTAKQKADKARAEAMLEAMRAQGIDVPQAGEKRGPRPGTRIRPKKQKTPETEKPPEEEVVKDEEAKEEEKQEPEAKDGEMEGKEEDEKVAEAWDAESDEDDVKDSWDVDSEDEGEEEAEDSPKTAAKSKDDEGDDEDEEESDEEEEDEDESEEESEEDEKEDRRQRALDRIAKRKEENERNRSTDVLRAPVVCVLGHVDTGKTKILDKLRRTNVQDGEAGGITQQIGATNVPIEVIRRQCKMVQGFSCDKLPGLLIIDTPGHESFSNMRDRGSSLCDIAILVVDIMHGLEPQTIESINLLKSKKTPFVIALNKIDRLYEWESNWKEDVHTVIEGQKQNTRLEFDKRAKEVVTAMAEQGLNAALFYENPDSKTYISMVPTSAHSGDGMGNLMALLVSLSENMLAKRLALSAEVQASVLEMKAIPGLGTTIDVVLLNGSLREGQTLVLAGWDGPIVTQVKTLLTPDKMQDLRVKNTYAHHKEIHASQGVKICANDLEKAIAGLNLQVAYHPDEIDILREDVERSYRTALSSFKVKDRGVFVQASTLGSLEALLNFLTTSKIPYAGVKVGPVVKRDVMKASVMLEHEEKYTVILAFDVKVERDAQELADSVGVKIFQADIIYHLFDRFVAHQEELKRQKREEFKHQAVFPCKLRVLPNLVFNSRNPIVAGVVVEAGVVRQGTPLCVPSKEFLEVGICTSIESNHKEVETAHKGEEVCVKIDPIPGESPKMFGRHFDEKDLLVSKISRTTIDVCKQYFRDDLQKDDWKLMVELKKVFEIL